MGKQNNIVKFGFSAVPVFRSVPERFGVPGFITCHFFNAPINVKPQGGGGGGRATHGDFDSESLPLSGDFDT